jgi:hypothetical protein
VIKIIAVLIIILALIVIIVPQFENCSADGRSLTLESGKQIPMKCLWSARAELTLGIPLLAIGALMLLSRRKESIRGFSILSVIVGILVILIPINIIGVCSSEDMSCKGVLEPTMIVCGILTILAGLAALVLNERKTETAA